MLVYGDAVRRETVAQKIGAVRHYLSEAASAEPWIAAHGLLVAALIETGELAQGLADRAFEAHGRQDAPFHESDAAMSLTLALAEAVGLSWSERRICTEPALAAIAAVEACAKGGDLTVKLPEGFAHYALYPETYYEAARSLAGRDLSVIGIRSIGTTLAGMVAAGAGARCPQTVRPVGHPFDRSLALAEPLALPRGTEVAIVDEGPGLSGSSITAVATELQAVGIERERVHVFPSHANGPGPQASEAVRSFWKAAQLHLRTFDDAILTGGERGLVSWVADLTGEPVGDLREITGGAWRGTRGWHGDLPPVHPWQEKRKFLLESRSGSWLLRFAGLGRIGLEKLARAEALAEAGFAPKPLGFRHGFIVERWHGDARPLDPSGPERRRFLAHLGDYLGFRSRNFASDVATGASSQQLFDMLHVNAEEEFGPERARHLTAWRPLLARLHAKVSRIETDNRLHVWEWLILPDGRFLKADAVDHHAAHDLVGCQDIAWDIAGASIEFTLTAGERQDLISRIEQVGGFVVDRAQVRFATRCYPAFQLGYYREAAASTKDADEAGRLRAAAERYASYLSKLLASDAEPNAFPAGFEKKE